MTISNKRKLLSRFGRVHRVAPTFGPCAMCCEFELLSFARESATSLHLGYQWHCSERLWYRIAPSSAFCISAL